MRIKHPAFALSICALAACAPASDPAQSTATETPAPAALAPIPFGTIKVSDTGRCLTQAAPRPQTTIITEQIEVIPAVIGDDGRVITPPVFRTQSRPATTTVQPGRQFETLCPSDYTPERIATLQRALTVRGTYVGPITAVMDTATRTAVQAFQAPLGYDSPLLERKVAENIGIVPIAVLRAELPEE